MVADRADLRQNMGAKDHGMILPQLTDQITDLDDLFRIQTYRGLIQNDDLRVAKDRLCQSDSLSVTFGKVPDQTLLHIGDLCHFHDLIDLLLPLFFRNFFQFCHEVQVFSDSHVNIQWRKLRQITDGTLCLLRIFLDIFAIDGHSALRSCQVTRDDVHCRGFTGAVRTKKTVDLTLFHAERKMIYGYMVSVFFCKIGYFYHICLPYQLLALTSNNSRYLCQSLFGVLVLLYEANVIKR